MNIFELIFVDKNRQEVSTEEWLKGKEGTWELKYPVLAGIVFCLVLLMSIPLLLFIFTIAFIGLSLGVIIVFPLGVIITIIGGILTLIRKIRGLCFHKKALLGLLDRKTKKEQWYCSICNKIVLKKGRKS